MLLVTEDGLHGTVSFKYTLVFFVYIGLICGSIVTISFMSLPCLIPSTYTYHSILDLALVVCPVDQLLSTVVPGQMSPTSTLPASSTSANFPTSHHLNFKFYFDIKMQGAHQLATNALVIELNSTSLNHCHSGSELHILHNQEHKKTKAETESMYPRKRGRVSKMSVKNLGLTQQWNDNPNMPQ